MLRILSLLVFSFWATTITAGEFILLPAGEPACYSPAKVKTALEKDDISINDCGQIPNNLHVEVTDLEKFSAGGLEFQIRKFSFLQLLEDGTVQEAFLYGFLEIDLTIDQQAVTVAIED